MGFDEPEGDSDSPNIWESDVRRDELQSIDPYRAGGISQSRGMVVGRKKMKSRKIPRGPQKY
jgi:hypothetical protein